MVRIDLTIFSAFGLISAASVAGNDQDLGCSVDDDTCEDERGALIQIRERGGMNVNKANKPRVVQDQEREALLQTSNRANLTNVDIVLPVKAGPGNKCGGHTTKILSEQDCKDAANSDSRLKFKQSGSWSDTPKGCYVSGKSSLYFNKHETGGTGRKRTSMCKYDEFEMGSQSCPGGIVEEDLCKMGVKLFAKYGFSWGQSGWWKDSPYGCYVNLQKNANKVYFNKNPRGVGSSKKPRTRICWKDTGRPVPAPAPKPRPAPPPAPPPEPDCMDDDAGVKKVATSMELPYTNCAQVANHCGVAQFKDLAKTYCKWTCGYCNNKPKFSKTTGRHCPKGTGKINGEGLCMVAARKLGWWKQSGYYKDTPTGCYQDPKSRAIYYNKHSKGGYSSKKKRTRICLATTTTTTTTTEAFVIEGVCTDDDAAVQAFSEQEGLEFNTCADAANLCIKPEFQALARQFCPWTCGFCKDSKPSFKKVYGLQCPKGTGKITGAGLCMVAARGQGWWKQAGSYHNRPKGCYQDPKTKAYYFNKHKTGGYSSKNKRTIICTVTTTTTIPEVTIPDVVGILEMLLEGKDVDMDNAQEIFKALEPQLLKALRSKFIVDGVADVLADLLGFDEAEAESVGELIAEEITFDLLLKLKKGEAIDWGPILEKVKVMEDTVVAAFAEKLAVTLGLEDAETETIRTNLPAQFIFDMMESLLEGKAIDWATLISFFDKVEPIMVRVLSNQTLVDATIGRVARNLGLSEELTKQLEEKVGDPIVRKVLEQLKNGEEVDVDWNFMVEILEEAETFIARVFTSKLKYALGHHLIAQANEGGGDILGTLESLINGEAVDMGEAMKVLEYLKPVLLSSLRNMQLVDGVADVIADFFGLDEAAAEQVGEIIAEALRKDIIEKILNGEDVDWGPILASVKQMEDELVKAFAEKLSTLLGLTDAEHQNLRDNVPAQVIFKMTEDLLEGNDVDWSPLVDFFDKIEPALVRVLSNQTLVDAVVGRFAKSLGLDAQAESVVSETLGDPLVRKMLDQVEAGGDIDWAPVLEALNKVERYMIAVVQGKIQQLVAAVMSQAPQMPDPDSEPEPDPDATYIYDKCVNDDELVRQTAKKMKLGNVRGCGDVSSYCDEKEKYIGDALKAACPQTCGTCSDVTSGFILAEPNEDCAPGQVQVNSRWLCKLAGNAVGKYKHSGSWSDVPQGCYKKPGVGIYFNKHSSGKKNSKKKRSLLCQIKRR